MGMVDRLVGVGRVESCNCSLTRVKGTLLFQVRALVLSLRLRRPFCGSGINIHPSFGSSFLSFSSSFLFPLFVMCSPSMDSRINLGKSHDDLFPSSALPSHILSTDSTSLTSSTRPPLTSHTRSHPPHGSTSLPTSYSRTDASMTTPYQSLLSLPSSGFPNLSDHEKTDSNHHHHHRHQPHNQTHLHALTYQPNNNNNHHHLLPPMVATSPSASISLPMPVPVSGFGSSIASVALPPAFDFSFETVVGEEDLWAGLGDVEGFAWMGFGDR